MRRFLLPLFLVAGCGGDDPLPPPPMEAPTEAVCPEDRVCVFDMEVGVGLYEFESIAPGDDVVVVLGPQGGFHVWIATRCLDCSSQVLIEYGMRGSADDSWLLGQPLRGIVNLEAGDGDWQQITGLFGLLPGGPETVDYVDLTMQMDVTIIDDDRQSSRVIPVRIANVEVWDCPTSDPEACR